MQRLDCPLLRQRPRVRRVDNRPTGHVARGDGVGRPSEATAGPPKRGLSRTMPIVHHSTSRTGARGMARIRQDRGDPRQPRLVLNKRPQLWERPTMLATPLLQEPLGGFGACPLQALAELLMPFPPTIDLVARIRVAIRISGDVHNPAIDAQPVVRLPRRFGHGHDYGPIKLTLAADQIRLSPNATQALGVGGAPPHGHHRATIHSQNGHAVPSLPRPQAIIAHDGSRRAKVGCTVLSRWYASTTWPIARTAICADKPKRSRTARYVRWCHCP
jgi:hypothetical protein